MKKTKITRRTFLKTVSAGAAGTALIKPAASYARILGTNDRIRVGIVGFSDRARHSLIPSLLQHTQELNFEIVAVSDIWNRRREEEKAFLEERTGRSIISMRNNEELYASMQQSVRRLGAILQEIEEGKGTLGKLAQEEELYHNFNQLSAELVKFIYDFRQNPKKFLTIKFEIF